MQHLKVLIVEDQHAEASYLKDALLQLGYDVPPVATTLEEGMEYFALHQPDISLVDIYLHGRPDGIAFGMKMNEQEGRKPFVFITSAVDASTFHIAKYSKPYHYLLKPFNRPELQYAIELAFERHKEESMPKAPVNNPVTLKPLFVKRGNTLVKCPYDDIKYIEVEGKYSKIVCHNEKFLVQQALKELCHQLPNTQFFRIHRNYIINVKEVTRLDAHTNEVFFKDGYTLFFSRRYMEAFFHCFNLLR